MIHLATALIALGDTQSAQALETVLASRGYTCLHTSDAGSVLSLAKDRRPDVLILGPGLLGGDQVEVVSSLRMAPETRTLPLFFLSEHSLEDVGDRLLDLGVDDALQWPCNPELVLARVRPLVRVATMRTEYLTRRAAVPDPLAEEEAAALPQTPASILVIGEETASEAVLQALPDASLRIARDLVEAQQLMDDRLFDAAIMAPQGNAQPYLDLCLQIRRNVRLFNLPVVFLSPTASLADQTLAMSMGASSALGMAPSANELRFTLRMLVRRQRLRWALRRDLGNLLTAATVDPVIPGVYSRSFLEHCLSVRLSEQGARRRRFSVIGLAFAGVDAIRHEFGEDSEHSLLLQIGQWLSLLVRAEDMVVSLGGARFALMLPDTPLSEAQVVMHRIAGVISNTEFAAKDVYRVVTVWPFVNAAEITDTDTPETVLARAAAIIGEGMAPW